MITSDTIDSFELDSVVEHARELWRGASVRGDRCRIELYSKLGTRIRVERGRSPGQPALRHATETGIAVRALTSPSDDAGFAATSGFSREAVRWAVDRAVAGESRVSGMSPSGTGASEDDLWDLDPVEEPPSRQALLSAFHSTPPLEWIEAGTTTEVLMGLEGRLAVRRRHRVWAMVQTEVTRFAARRHLLGWQDILDGIVPGPTCAAKAPPTDMGSVVFLPEAAAPIVLALAGSFHVGETPEGVLGGSGWTVDDDPLQPSGLGGGTFDDAGFKAEVRALARNGRLDGRICGPGTFRRRSFRDKPQPAPSNLTMPPGSDASGEPSAPCVDHSRLFRLGPGVWVLELELAPTPDQPRRRAHVRISPEELLRRCAARIGPARVTADGPIVPSLRFDGLPFAFDR